MKQFVLGMTFQVGPNTFVFGASTQLFVLVPADYKITVAPSLIKAGVRPVISRGKIRFSKGVYNAAVVVDHDLQQVTVRPVTKDILAASFAQSDIQAKEAAAKLEEFAHDLKVGETIGTFWRELKTEMKEDELVAELTKAAKETLAKVKSHETKK